MKKLIQINGKKTLVILMALALVLIIGLMNSWGGGSPPTIKDYMDGHEWQQAIYLLKAQVKSRPTNAVAHFNLGVCYANLFNFQAADESFEKATIHDSRLGKKIGEVFLNAGKYQLGRGNFNEVDGLFKKALFYNQNLLKIVSEVYYQGGENALLRNDLAAAKELFGKAIGYNFSHRTPAMNAYLDRGKALLAVGETTRAEELFETAIYFSADVRNQLCDIYFEQGRATTKPSDFNLLERAKKYGSHHDEEILEIQIARLPGKTVRMELGPNEVKDIAEITPGQKWQYLYFKGDFSHRVTIGNTPPEIGDWKKVDNGLPWNAGQSGKLQIKSRSTSIFVVNIQ